MWWKPKAPAEPIALYLNDRDFITVNQCTSGVVFVSETGGGKSTIGELLALPLMQHGAGFLWLCPKMGEYERALKLARQCGREADVIRFAKNETWRFNFLDHEIRSKGGSVESAAQLLRDLVDAVSQSISKGDEPFWPMSSARQLGHCLLVQYTARGKADVTELFRVATSLPNSIEERESPQWWKDSFAAHCLQEAGKKSQSRDLDLAAEFMLEEWPRLSTKTTASISAYTMAVLTPFVAGSMAHLVTGDSNITPDDIYKRGAIVVCDCPVLVDREPGRFMNLVWKICTQRAVLRRDVAAWPKPCVQWADECQLFTVPSTDMLTATVQRQSRYISVAMFQSLPVLVAALGGDEKARNEASGFLSNHTTKLIGANSCKETNAYFQELFGQSKQLLMNANCQSKAYHPFDAWMGNEPHGSTGFGQSWAPLVRSEAFTQCRKGGESNAFMVDMYCYQGGRRWSNHKPFIRASFRQPI